MVKELKDEVKDAAEIYLATDPDREGEAIAWHLMAATDLDQARAKRVVFHEITQGAVSDAFAHARQIDMNLVNAQQTRRILDRLVGYKISPLLWEKVRGRLTAGRVQSVAVRLVVEREREIAAFEPVEYWSIDALLAKHEDSQEGAQLHRSPAPHQRPGSRSEGPARHPGHRRRPAAGPIYRHAREERRAQAESVASVHHEHDAAGSIAAARLQRQADDGRCPGAVRGRGARTAKTPSA